MSIAAPADHRPSKSTAATHTLHTGLAIGLVYLDRWPDLPSQLSEREVLINKICNELSKKPRASHLIHLLVRAPKDDVQAALRTLLQTGCIHIGRASTVPGTGVQPMYGQVAENYGAAPANPADEAPAAGMLGKLWSKLST